MRLRERQKQLGRTTRSTRSSSLSTFTNSRPPLGLNSESGLMLLVFFRISRTIKSPRWRPTWYDTGLNRGPSGECCSQKSWPEEIASGLAASARFGIDSSSHFQSTRCAPQMRFTANVPFVILCQSDSSASHIFNVRSRMNIASRLTR